LGEPSGSSVWGTGCLTSVMDALAVLSKYA
jgi:hypothetical protein